MMNTRRDFIGNTFAAGLASAASGAVADIQPAAKGVWGGWKPGEFQVHFIYTGVGESMFMIFPDGTNGDEDFKALLEEDNVIWTGPAAPSEVPARQGHRRS